MGVDKNSLSIIIINDPLSICEVICFVIRCSNGLNEVWRNVGIKGNMLFR